MASSLPGRVQEVVHRILSDGEFAAEVRRLGIDAVRGGAKSEAFKKYFDVFALTPGELDGLSAGPGSEGCTCDSNTWFTFSSLAGPLYTCCATTTTTTTTGNFFSR